jgi:hypothetical protein
MTPRQKIAFENPCTRADETVAKRFQGMDMVDGMLLGSLLTLNK